MAEELRLSYEEVLEYLDDRKGDEVMVSAYPVFHLGDEGLSDPSPITLLGLTLTTTVEGVEAVPIEESNEWLHCRAGVCIRLGEEGSMDGLVLVREWFAAAILNSTAPTCVSSSLRTLRGSRSTRPLARSATRTRSGM
jgi:hypothetical protein